MAHPVQYHFFKHTIRRLREDGCEVKLVIKTKDVLEQLLKDDGEIYTNIQKTVRKKNVVSILFAALQRSWALLSIAAKFRPDILLGTGADVAHAAWLLGKPCVTTLEDDIYLIKNLARLTYPFTTDILVPLYCRVGKWEKKKIGYAGNMKLAYLHPRLFTPQKSVIEKYGITERYILIRKVSLSAYHDIGVRGLNEEIIKKVIAIAAERGYKTYISSEGEIYNSLKPYLLQINPSDMHHIIAFASMMISDSQSMSVEAAVLGVPNIRFSDLVGKVGVLSELHSRYNLTYGVRTCEKERLLRETVRYLDNPNLKNEYQKRREEMLKTKIDVTAFLTWYIENYPESRKIMKQNPDFHNKFKTSNV